MSWRPTEEVATEDRNLEVAATELKAIVAIERSKVARCVKMDQ